MLISSSLLMAAAADAVAVVVDAEALLVLALVTADVVALVESLVEVD